MRGNTHVGLFALLTALTMLAAQPSSHVTFNKQPWDQKVTIVAPDGKTTYLGKHPDLANLPVGTKIYLHMDDLPAHGPFDNAAEVPLSVIVGDKEPASNISNEEAAAEVLAQFNH